MYKLSFAKWVEEQGHFATEYTINHYVNDEYIYADSRHPLVYLNELDEAYKGYQEYLNKII